MAVVDRRQPHPAPARRPDPGPARRAVRRPRRGRLRALQRRAARHARRTSRRRSRSPSGPGCCWCPHGGELRGPDHIRICLDTLHADRLGHGVRSAEDPGLLDRIVEAGVALEVCPVSNVALGVYSDLTSVPLPRAAGGRRHGRARRRRPAAVRVAAGRRSTPPCAPPTSSPTTSSPSWPGCRSAPRAPPPTWSRAPSPTSTPGWPHPPAWTCQNSNRSCLLRTAARRLAA